MAPSDRDMNVSLTADCVLIIDSPFGDTSPFNIMQLSLLADLSFNGTVFGSMTIENTPVRPIYNGNQSVADQFNLTLSNATLTLISGGLTYTEFVRSFLEDPLFTLSMTAVSIINASYIGGSLTLRGLNITTDSPLVGMNGPDTYSNAINITSNQTQCAAVVCGADIELFVFINNPSVIDLRLGNVNFSLSVNGQSLGGLTSDSVTLNGGSLNIQRLTGRLLPNQTAESLAAASTLISSLINNQSINVRLSAIVNNDDLSALALTVGQIDVTAVTAVADGQVAVLIRSIVIEDLLIGFGANSRGTMTASARLTSDFHLPTYLALNTSINQTALRSTLYFDSAPLATLCTDEVAVVQTYNIDQRGTDNLAMTIPPNSELTRNQTFAFQQFAAALVTSDVVNFSLSGTVSPQAQTVLGRLTLSDIRADSNVSLSGINQFYAANLSSLFIIENIDVIAANATVMTVAVSVVITNPSDVALDDIGTLRLDVVYNNAVIGTLYLPNFTLPFGTFAPLNAVAYVPILTGDNATALSDVLSTYINRNSQPVTLTGAIRQDDGSYVPGTDVDVLTTAIESLSTSSEFPASPVDFLNKFEVSLTCRVINSLICGGENPHLMQTNLVVTNPFSTLLNVVAADLVVSIQAFSNSPLQIGEWLFPSRDAQCNFTEPVVFPPNAAVSKSTTICMDLYPLQWWILPSVVTALLNGTALTANGTITVNISTNVAGPPAPSNNSYSSVIRLLATDVPLTVTTDCGECDECFKCGDTMTRSRHHVT